jgi:hypothetical protein
MVAVQPAAQRAQRRVQRPVRLAPMRLVSAGAMHRSQPMRARQPGDDLHRIAPAQGESAAPRGDSLRQRGQRMMQPPAAGRARLFIENIEQQQRLAAGRRRVQGGVVGEAQIVAEPDEPGHATSGRRPNCSRAKE